MHRLTFNLNDARLSEIVELTTLKVDVAKVHFVEVHRRKAPRLPPPVNISPMTFISNRFTKLIATHIHRFTRFI